MISDQNEYLYTVINEKENSNKNKYYCVKNRNMQIEDIFGHPLYDKKKFEKNAVIIFAYTKKMLL